VPTGGYDLAVPAPTRPQLSASQLATLARSGEERTAGVGDVLYRDGDRRYPFVVVVEGEVAVLDEAGNEIVRHGLPRRAEPPRGPDVFVTAVVTKPLRYIAVDRDDLRGLLFEDGPLSDPLLSTFIARREVLEAVHGGDGRAVRPRAARGVHDGARLTGDRSVHAQP
jgi:hypothetical protein